MRVSSREEQQNRRYTPINTGFQGFGQASDLLHRVSTPGHPW
jgi:hypothetical protein